MRKNIVFYQIIGILSLIAENSQGKSISCIIQDKNCLLSNDQYLQLLGFIAKTYDTIIAFDFIFLRFFQTIVDISSFSK